MRFFFAFNVVLWCVLFAGWLGYLGLAGISDPVSGQVGCILAVTAVLIAAHGAVRWRRRRALTVSA